MTDDILSLLMSHRDSTPEKMTRFFKTAPGTYGAHDQFLGITNPTLRRLSKGVSLPDATLSDLLQSPYNEVRLFALLVLNTHYTRAPEHAFQFYCAHLDSINNWNLVDLSAPLIPGHYLRDKDLSLLTTWAQSPIHWHRRIAIVSTLGLIRVHQLDPTYNLASLLERDPEDLMHKATGWMLREAGKKEPQRLRTYLKSRLSNLPRTTLRYAIERFPEEVRQEFLRG